MEGIKSKLKAVIGDKNVQIVDGETGKELSLDELVDKLSKPSEVVGVEGNFEEAQKIIDVATTLVFLKRSAKEVRTCLSKLPMSREISLAITKLDECMLWVKSFEMNNKKD